MGVVVGILDVALLWPLVVLASRREAGSPSISHAVRQGRPWAGGLTAMVMLVPYCIAVESLGNLATEGKAWDEKLPWIPLSSLPIAVGLQPIEKKLAMDSLLQTNRSGKGPFYDLALYVKANGIRRLYGGFLWLWSREMVYMSTVTVLNPALTASIETDYLAKCATAFAIGFTSGMVSAPLQTVNILYKDERNVSNSWKQMIGSKPSWRRFFDGSGSRSFRTGLAGILWFSARDAVK